MKYIFHKDTMIAEPYVERQFYIHLDEQEREAIIEDFKKSQKVQTDLDTYRIEYVPGFIKITKKL